MAAPKLTEPASYYTPDYFRSMDPRDLRKWYSASRSVANKRVARLNKSQFADLQDVRNYAAGFPKLSSLDSRALVYESVKLARFLSWKGSTIKGQKKMLEGLIKGMSEAGAFAKGVAVELVGNIREAIKFAQYMAKAKATGVDKTYGSEVVLDAYNRAKELGIDPMDLLKGAEENLSGFGLSYEVLKVKEVQVSRLKRKTARYVYGRMQKVDSDYEVLRGMTLNQLRRASGTKKWLPYAFVIDQLIKNKEAGM